MASDRNPTAMTLAGVGALRRHLEGDRAAESVAADDIRPVRLNAYASAPPLAAGAPLAPDGSS
jgi:hypothetical protein